MFAALANSCLAKGGTVDFYVPRRELADQARAIMPRANITTIQAAIRQERRHPTMQLIDEAHHQVGPEWATVASERSIQIGATATPVAGLRNAFDELVVAISIREATEQGFLVPCEVIGPDETLPPGQLAQHPWAAYRAYADGSQAIVFSSSVEVAEEHAWQFRNAGIPAACIHGESADRDPDIARFRSGELRVLTSVQVLTEGFDHPPVSTCILATRCGSVQTYLQRVGRVLRPAPGKTGALVIDLCGSTLTHQHPAAERTFHLDEAPIRLAQHDDGVRFCRVCGAIILVPGECDECGAAKEKNWPVVVDKPLRVYAWQRLQGDDEETRIRRLAKWLREAEKAGHKPGRALYRYKASYREWPTPEQRAKAAAIHAA